MNRSDLLYYLQSIVGQYPSLYFKIFARHYPFSQMKIQPDSGICIEGFPRSANSYAVVAFRMANPGVKIAHHLHVPAQLLQAVRWRIPAVLLIRDPLEAVASFMVFQQSANADLYLKLYAQFHKALVKVKRSLVLVDFETVVKQFDDLIVKVNQRFATNFSLLENQIEREKEIFDKLKKVNDQFFKKQWQKSMFPDERRQEFKTQARKRIEQSPYYALARQYYNEFLKESLNQINIG